MTKACLGWNKSSVLFLDFYPSIVFDKEGWILTSLSCRLFWLSYLNQGPAWDHWMVFQFEFLLHLILNLLVHLTCFRTTLACLRLLPTFDHYLRLDSYPRFYLLCLWLAEMEIMTSFIHFYISIRESLIFIDKIQGFLWMVKWHSAQHDFIPAPKRKSPYHCWNAALSTVCCWYYIHVALFWGGYDKWPSPKRIVR